MAHRVHRARPDHKGHRDHLACVAGEARRDPRAHRVSPERLAHQDNEARVDCKAHQVRQHLFAKQKSILMASLI